jgi:Protein of unknown function (DUF4239)
MYPFRFLEHYSWFMGVVVCVLALMLFASIGILLVRKTVNIKKLKSHHDFAGFVFTNLGVLYAVLLGFTVVNVQNRFDKIEENLQQEAGYLNDLYRDAEIFFPEDRENIHSAIKYYIEYVIHQEWGNTLQENQIKAALPLTNLWSALINTTLQNEKQQIWYKESVSKLNLLTNARIFRLLAGEESLKPQMWSILILGAILILAFTWFFGLENLSSHLLITAFLAAATATPLFLIYSLDTAFTGVVKVSPEAFIQLLKLFKESR